eukprot:TRINITY_DN1613_c0_g1_i1.p1 TRINITY_DN1613_c0_g1~~TRINITY_DN1613_c0_g1_i1.p1  ORF type:complete len:124 (-),score=40.96 TRINITY_DN1613_c0_g1_i1:70-441(-)
MSRLLSPQEVLRNQLKLIETNRPVNNWKKNPEHGKTLVERERKKREQQKERALEKNKTYFKHNHKPVSKHMASALELKNPQKAGKKKDEKKAVPVGQRVLGPGFLQRYGIPETTQQNKKKNKK